MPRFVSECGRISKYPCVPALEMGSEPRFNQAIRVTDLAAGGHVPKPAQRARPTPSTDWGCPSAMYRMWRLGRA